MTYSPALNNGAPVSPEYTHYLITSGGAVGVIAQDRDDAMQQAAAMGIYEMVKRVDVALSQEEWDATAQAAACRLPTHLNGYKIIASKPHANGYVTVACELGASAAHRYVVATWWPDLGATWSWGHYENSYRKTFNEVCEKNAARGNVRANEFQAQEAAAHAAGVER